MQSSQEFPMAKWAIARRCAGVTDAMIGEAFDDGRFLRTHILRPTWHFVLPEDLGWMMAVTAPRVNRLMAGKQHTYVLAPEGVTEAAAMSEDEALARLARTYVRGHGPSQPADLSWWSSLTLTQSRRAFELAGFGKRVIDGQVLWYDELAAEESPLPRAALLSPFDECISYVAKPVDTSRFPGKFPDLARGGGLLLIDGLIGGTWARKVKPKCVEVDVQVHGPLPRAVSTAIESEAARYAAFIESEMVLNITS